MKHLILLLAFLSVIRNYAQNITITELTPMPKAISNNAVTEGYINGNPYVFSFGGIDTSKIYSGITNESFRYDITNDVWDTIPPLPNSINHIAAAASYVNGIIYIIGGYSVASNGSEVSSKKVHRYDPVTNSYLQDGVNLPIAIDDQVQAVYKDSLIYIVTGWSNTTNVFNVQIYDTYLDSWSFGTAVSGSSSRVFGSTGTIIGDTIFYFGGATTGTNFPTSNYLRKGFINPMSPNQIIWQVGVPNTAVRAYRPSCTNIGSEPIWVGGSSVSYNYNGIAYNGSGGVTPNNSIIKYANGQIQELFPQTGLIPMDLRGLASISDSIKYIVGGMNLNQQVSNKTLRVKFDLTTSIEEGTENVGVEIYPNPVQDLLTVKWGSKLSSSLTLYNINGARIRELIFSEKVEFSLGHLEPGAYIIQVQNKEQTIYKKLMVN